ncbi:MAG: hypothetical protein ACKOXL_01205, partial [Limnohabitans sp.]
MSRSTTIKPAAAVQAPPVDLPPAPSNAAAAPMVPAVLTQAVRVRGRKRPLPQDPADPVDAASVQAPDPARERTADTPTDPNGQHARQDEQAAVPADDRRVLRDTDPDGASVAWG